jgi:hypothetical protein
MAFLSFGGLIIGILQWSWRTSAVQTSVMEDAGHALTFGEWEGSIE